MAILAITNLDTATYESVFGPILAGATRVFSGLTTTQLDASLAALNLKVAAGELNYQTLTDPAGSGAGSDVQNKLGKLTVASLVAESQTISGDIVVDDITCDDIAADAITATSAVATGAVQGATVVGTTSVTGAAVVGTNTVTSAALIGTASTTTVNLTATGSLAEPPVIVLFAASPFTATAKPGFLCDATDGAIVFNLPAASAVAGRHIRVKKTDAVANNVTVTRAGSDTIDGANTKVLTAQYDFLEIVSDGVATWTVYANKLT